MTDWQKIRDLFPATKNHTYLMSAAAGPLHPAAFKRSSEFAEELFHHGDVQWDQFESELIEVRKKVAKFLNVLAEEICFVSSSSMAMNIIALHLKTFLQEDGRKGLAPFREFPSTTLPWIKHGYSLSWIKEDFLNESAIERALKESKAKVLLHSHVQYATGYRQDLNLLMSLAEKFSLITVVNATQSLGAFEVDASKIDFLCASVHKWLMSGYGLCVLKIGKKFLSRPLPLHGWLSEVDPWPMQNQALHPVYEARALELGCSPLQAIFSVGAVVDWIETNVSISSIEKRILELRALAIEKFNRAGLKLSYNFETSNGSGILYLKTDRPAKEIELELAKKNVFVNARGDNLRISLHYFNDESDIDRFIQQVST